MKIYVQDYRWAGNIVVVADDENEARSLMAEHPCYEPSASVEELAIEKGVVAISYGDL